MRPASSCRLPRRLLKVPLRSRFCPALEGLRLEIVACRFGFSAPPIRSRRSPPPVRCSWPSLTRPVDPTAAMIAPERGAIVETNASPIASRTPASRPASSVRLPPPNVPKPVKPTIRGRGAGGSGHVGVGAKVHPPAGRHRLHASGAAGTLPPQPVADRGTGVQRPVAIAAARLCARGPGVADDIAPGFDAQVATMGYQAR
jgi:hypothetical protein